MYYKFESSDVNASNKLLNYANSTYDLQLYSNSGSTFTSSNSGITTAQKKFGSSSLITYVNSTTG